MLLKSIVNCVLKLIKKEPLEVAKHPVGMDEIVRDFERNRQEYVESEKGVEIVGIVGLGGCGKTTLATELYNRKSSSFKHSSFLHDVRDSRHVLHTKQKELLTELRIKTESIDNWKKGKAIMAERLRSLCMLIVLDDVDHEDQLDALLPPKERLGRGSLVIITTRDMGVLTKCDITFIYKIKPLQNLYAKQLFCWHAFMQPSPLQGFEVLVQSILSSCKGLPLSLKVIGGQLYSKSKDYWDSELKKIQKYGPEKIKERLKVSYDALDEDEKEVFLDIACFFIGERKDLAIDVWDASGWSGLCRWEALQNKCLVEMDFIFYRFEVEKHIRMHDHLRDLGREIAKTHSPRRSWFEGAPFGGITASGDHRVKLKWSEVVEIEPTKKWAELMRGGLWLQFNRSIPSWFSVDTITNLEFTSRSSLETLWEDVHPPLQLRELRVFEVLELQRLPRSIGRLQHLKRLYLRDTFCLSRLPEEFCELQLLEHLDLLSCYALSSLPDRFGDLVKLRHLNLGDCGIERFPESFKQLINLKYLALYNCDSLQSLDNIANVKALCFSDWIREDASVGGLFLQLNLYFIGTLLPTIGQVHEFNTKVPLFYDEWPRESPNFVRNISTLTSQTPKYSRHRECLPLEISQISNLQNLIIDSYYGLYKISNLAGLVSLTNLEVKKCYNLNKIEGLEHLTSLENLVLWGSWKKPIIQSLRGLERLQKLNLRGQNLSVFGDCIQSIEMKNWPSEMTICGEVCHSYSQHNFKLILDSFTSPGVVLHPMREWSLIGKKSFSNATVVCYLFKGQIKQEVLGWNCARTNKAGSTRLELPRPVYSLDEWIMISVFKENSFSVEHGLLSLDLGRQKVEVLGGWVMDGERACILDAFKQLFQALCNCETQFHLQFRR